MATGTSAPPANQASQYAAAATATPARPGHSPCPAPRLPRCGSQALLGACDMAAEALEAPVRPGKAREEGSNFVSLGTACQDAMTIGGFASKYGAA